MNLCLALACLLMIGLTILGTTLFVPCKKITLLTSIFPCWILRVPRNAVTDMAALEICIGATIVNGAISFAWLMPIVTLSSWACMILGGHPIVTV